MHVCVCVCIFAPILRTPSISVTPEEFSSFSFSFSSSYSCSFSFSTSSRSCSLYHPVSFLHFPLILASQPPTPPFLFHFHLLFVFFSFFSPPFFASSLSNTSSPLSSAATAPPLCLKIVHHFRKGQPGCRHRDATVAATLHTAVVIGVRLVAGITNHVHFIGLRDGWTASRPVGVHGACSGTSGGGRAE